MSDLSPAVQKFLLKYVQSVWQLELILFLRRRADLPTSADEAAAALYIHAPVIKTALSAMARNGIVELTGDGRYVFSSGNERLARAVDETATAYTQKRVAVINFIFSRSLQSFSDAFKFGEDDE